MWSLFHGWRRKAAVVMLVMACMLATLWIRSLSIGDLLELRLSKMSQLTIMSAAGDARVSYNWVVVGSFEGDPSFQWDTFDTRSDSGGGLLGFFNGSWIRSGAPLTGIAAASGDSAGVHVPYAFATIPLTLLSACLLLWKPRKAKSSDQPAISKLISD